jgi:hypothetical protein
MTNKKIMHKNKTRRRRAVRSNSTIGRRNKKNNFRKKFIAGANNDVTADQYDEMQKEERKKQKLTNDINRIQKKYDAFASDIASATNGGGHGHIFYIQDSRGMHYCGEVMHFTKDDNRFVITLDLEISIKKPHYKFPSIIGELKPRFEYIRDKLTFRRGGAPRYDFDDPNPEIVPYIRYIPQQRQHNGETVNFEYHEIDDYYMVNFYLYRPE